MQNGLVLIWRIPWQNMACRCVCWECRRSLRIRLRLMHSGPGRPLRRLLLRTCWVGISRLKGPGMTLSWQMRPMKY